MGTLFHRVALNKRTTHFSFISLAAPFFRVPSLFRVSPGARLSESFFLERPRTMPKPSTQPSSPQQAPPITSQIHSINHRLNRHRDDLDNLLNASQKSLKTAFDLQTTKTSIRTGQVLCTTRCVNATIRISELENFNEALTAEVKNLKKSIEVLTNQVRDLKLVNDKPRCLDCRKPFTPVRKSHQKCPKCFLSLKIKLCKNCSKPFTPKHHSYKYCPCCSKK